MLLTVNFLYLSILIHVLGAIAWLGSLVAIEFIILPAFIKNSGSMNSQLLANVSKRFAMVAQIASILILLTGIYQTLDLGYLDINKLFQTSYGLLIVLKVISYVIFAGLGIRAGLMLSKLDPAITNEKIVLVIEKAKKFLYIDLAIGLLIIIIAIALNINLFS